MGVKTLFVINTCICIGYCLLISLYWKISASTAQKYIAINITGKDDLSITCSIINFDQLDVLYLIQLRRKNDTKFDNVITITNGTDIRQIQWKDEVLKNRATANGTIEEAALRLFIDRESVQCFTDFTEYKCRMVGVLKSALAPVDQETDNFTASNIHACTCMYVYLY